MFKPSSTIPILASCTGLQKTASELASTFHLPLVDSIPVDSPYYLYLTTERLELHNFTNKPIFVDFVGGILGYRCRHGGGRKQALAKAIGLKHGATPTVVDATAGLGKDAFVLASLGCHVKMLERSPIVAALLYDGLQRAETIITDHLSLIYQDAENWLSKIPILDAPDVIYLDPMYPHRKKSALVKKEMRLFREIVGEDLDAPALLKTALACAARRVVVKRPKLATPLADYKPSFCIKSENTRFDVYQVGLNVSTQL
jgi:16S rRNA (guanine1516-N2)-methyltransferase